MIAYYTIKFVYKDEKEHMVEEILPEKLGDFFQQLSAHGVYWYGDDRTQPTNGFWTNINDVRYFHITAVEGEENEEIKSTETSDNETSQNENGNDTNIAEHTET